MYVYSNNTNGVPISPTTIYATYFSIDEKNRTNAFRTLECRLLS